ncbi:MAG: acyltransferase, partial [Kiloniellaceae bacterium]
MKYRPDVDGLRAVAILPVVLFHSGVSGFSGGFVGVDVFFVISGYVIALSLQEDLDKGRFSIWRFYAKRIRRIFPALFVTIAATCVCAYLLLLPSFYIDFSQSLLAASVFLSNVYFWRT